MGEAIGELPVGNGDQECLISRRRSLVTPETNPEDDEISGNPPVGEVLQLEGDSFFVVLEGVRRTRVRPRYPRDSAFWCGDPVRWRASSRNRRDSWP